MWALAELLTERKDDRVVMLHVSWRPIALVVRRPSKSMDLDLDDKDPSSNSALDTDRI